MNDTTGSGHAGAPTSAHVPGLSAMSSRRLLSQALRGNSRAVDHLFRRYTPFLRRLGHGRLPRWARDLADTADLVQDTLLRTFRKLPGLNATSDTLRPYLRQALLNRVNDELRRVTRRPVSVELDVNHPDGGRTPLALAISREDDERFRLALLRLHEGDRRAIVARIDLGYSYDQTALVLGKATPDAARVAVRRALLRLAAEMRDDAGQ